MYSFLLLCLSLVINVNAYIDLSTLEREKKQHERQARDATASQATTRKRLELEFTEMVSQQKAAANAANAAKVMQPRKISRQNNDQR